MRAFARACGTLAAFLAAASASLAQIRDYDTCIGLAAEAPAKAEAAAADWISAGGGPAAIHCRAIALLALGAEERAARVLIGLATEAAELPNATRAEIFLQAGELLLALGDFEAGMAVANRALNLAADTAPALELRARFHAENRNWATALKDLNRALAEGGADPGRLVLRASAKRALGRMLAARDDLKWALELAPDLAEAWLELGTVEARMNDPDAARAAWLETIRLAPDTELARAARARLQAMEAAD